MRHHKKKRVFGRERNQYRALMKSLAEALILRGRIKTTEAKARELRPFVEKLVTLARQGTVASRRITTARTNSSTGTRLVARGRTYIDRKGGYTRIVKLGRRAKDAAKMAIIEFV